MIGSFLFGVHFIFDFIDIVNHAFDVDIFEESSDNVLKDILSCSSGSFSSFSCIFWSDIENCVKNVHTLGSSETDFSVGMKSIG